MSPARTAALPALILAGLAACAAPPRDGAEAARRQAALAVDPKQAELWRAAVDNPALAELDRLVVTEGTVRQLTAETIPDRSIEPRRVPFPAAVETGVRIVAAPQSGAPYRGPARVRAADGEFIDLEFGDGRSLSIQAKVGGGRLRARAGEPVEVVYRAGVPFDRDDVLSLSFVDDDFLHALVGGDAPIRFRVAERDLTAEQVAPVVDNGMPVRVTVGGETRVLRAGERAEFADAGLTIALGVSIAVAGEPTTVLEGQPYLVKLTGWRTGRR